MGILDDLSMGLGLKDRDEDYYERTAKTLGRTQGAGREAAYRQSNVFQNQPQRAGLLSFMGGGNNQGGGMGNRVANVFGYRDMTDMGDGGGRYASGGYYRGGGMYSGLANLGAALSGEELGDFSFAPEVDAMIEEMQGVGSAKYLREKEPEMYRMLGQNIIQQNFRGGFF